jgi:hypothetical protein
LILERYVKVFTAIIVAALGVVALGLNLAEAGPPSLPLSVAGPAWQPLSQRRDPRLQARLEQALQQHAAWRPLLAQGKMSVGLVDLSNPKAPRAALVNGDTMMYGASLPKLMILLAAFQGFEDGSLKDTPEVHRDLIEMIRRSDNLAASRVIGLIGLRKIEALASDRRYRFYDPKKGTHYRFVPHGHGLPALPVLLPAGLRPAHQPGALAPNAENPGVSRPSRQVRLGVGERCASELPIPQIRGGPGLPCGLDPGVGCGLAALHPGGHG